MPFVVEADEYAGNFDAYRPAVAVLTSAEWDHPDVFADRAAVLAAFEALDPPRGRSPGPAGQARRPCSSRTSPTRASPSSPSGWPTGPAGSSRPRSSTSAPQRASGFARGIAERFRTAAGPAEALLGRITAVGPRGDDARDPSGWTRSRAR